MQKTSNKASILIWATFLSLIITVSFVGISTKINKNLQNNKALYKNIEIDNQVKEIINSGSLDGSYKNQYLENGDKIIFTRKNLINTSLLAGKTHISKLNTDGNINIEILSGGPVDYKNNSATGLIIDKKTFSTTIGNLEINNLGGYTKIKISSDKKTNNLEQFSTYKIYKKIGNKEIIRTQGTIKNF